MAVNVLNIGSVTLPGKGYLPMAAFNIPDTVGLEGCFLFGEGPELATKNYAPGKPDASLVGSIVDGVGYCTLPNLSYLQTEVDETAAMTFLLIGRETSADSVGWIGNYLSGEKIGVSLYTTTGSVNMTANVGRNNADPSSAAVSANTAEWGLYTLEIPATGAFTLRNFATGGVVVSPNTGDRLVAGAGKMRIGRLKITGFAGAMDVCVAMMFSRSIVVADMAATRVWARNYAAGFGIVVS